MENRFNIYTPAKLTCILCILLLTADVKAQSSIQEARQEAFERAMKAREAGSSAKKNSNDMVEKLIEERSSSTSTKNEGSAKVLGMMGKKDQEDSLKLDAIDGNEIQTTIATPELTATEDSPEMDTYKSEELDLPIAPKSEMVSTDINEVQLVEKAMESSPSESISLVDEDPEISKVVSPEMDPVMTASEEIKERTTIESSPIASEIPVKDMDPIKNVEVNSTPEMETSSKGVDIDASMVDENLMVEERVEEVVEETEIQNSSIAEFKEFEEEIRVPIEESVETSPATSLTNVSTTIPDPVEEMDSKKETVEEEDFGEEEMVVESPSISMASLVEEKFNKKVETVVKTEANPIEKVEEVENSRYKAHNFDAVGINGGKATLADYKGKVVVMNFWWPGCKMCLKEMPKLNELADKYKGQDVVFLAFCTESAANAKKVFEKHTFNYEQFVDSRDIAENYNIFLYPGHVVIDKEGGLMLTNSGDTAALLEKIDQEIAIGLKE